MLRLLHYSFYFCTANAGRLTACYKQKKIVGQKLDMSRRVLRIYPNMDVTARTNSFNNIRPTKYADREAIEAIIILILCGNFL